MDLSFSPLTCLWIPLSILQPYCHHPPLSATELPPFFPSFHSSLPISPAAQTSTVPSSLEACLTPPHSSGKVSLLLLVKHLQLLQFFQKGTIIGTRMCLLSPEWTLRRPCSRGTVPYAMLNTAGASYMLAIRDYMSEWTNKGNGGEAAVPTASPLESSVNTVPSCRCKGSFRLVKQVPQS